VYLLKNRNNLGDPKGIPGRGDVIVDASFRKSYVVAPDGSHRRLDREDHASAVARVRQELADVPQRRPAAAALSAQINREAELKIAQQLAARTDRMLALETTRLRARPWYQRLASALGRYRKQFQLRVARFRFRSAISV
jgi:hypothetical protein